MLATEGCDYSATSLTSETPMTVHCNVVLGQDLDFLLGSCLVVFNLAALKLILLEL